MADVQAAQPAPLPQQQTAGDGPGQQPATTTAAAPVGSFLGDNIICDAEMVYDQKRTINAPPGDIWPWLVQWGKDRGGWYLPAKVEKMLPEKYRSTPTIVPKWQALKVGDSVPDYHALSRKDADAHHIEVALMEPERALVYKGERAGVSFTWALLLEPTPAADTVLHLRFRGRSLRTGWKAKVAVQVAKVSDALMASAIFPGIADRVEPKADLKADKAKDDA